jgi:hypothetical protein
MDEYRILQLSDSTWGVEKARHFTKRGKWPWSPRIPCTEWVVALGFPGHPYPFLSLEKALKWIGDDRKFPIVVGYVPAEVE